MSGDERGDLPLLDEHWIRIPATRGRVWTALRRYVESSLGVGAGHPVAWLLGTEPRAGFEVAGEAPGHYVSMAGRHRFSRYLLVFELADVDADETLLTARSYAEFPGLHGRAYRALVVGGTRAHVASVRHMLRAIRRASLA